MKREALDDWLAWQLAAHPREIELGLGRVATVADRLGLAADRSKVLTVGGTNGKGSCVALSRGLIGARARIGCYTSPHLWRYNERITIDGHPVPDDEIVTAFEAIDAVRGPTPLTFFEWGTLAALWLFKRHDVTVRLLEVGLGGRLDAVNYVDAHAALVTSIGLDHTDWLGDTRDAIGYEKAGIYRAGRPALCADRQPPAGLVDQAHAVGADYRCIGTDFDIVETAGGGWSYHDGDGHIETPIIDGVHRDNLAGAIAAVRALGFEIGEADLARAGRAQRALPGRREMIDGAVPILYDVGHNDEAVALLADALTRQPVTGRTHVVIGMLADKPVEAVGARLADVADCWYPAGLTTITPRGLEGTTLARRLSLSDTAFADPATALSAAREASRPGDRIVVCGSFFTVAQARSPEQ
ncbi:folylpolyglutamate synthase/dihydrofolate synthase family protein [Salinisphaera sp. Q1T1-3]|uniref:bifunctional folylpolyglutamate synthase/dihydrofolate synthase n=1 Tax=Salinisphaera sp. Q1T1-3 TaxID=2321229 RepID=UPI000E764B5A|nr:folylpolyglutamate synthase/dihydrofolate synthase family protein [Salinisphaera sp. Q1T1-3]RJS95030.1 bifunctional folylpolyglutamate synthase/dihydrofolate synthase [Salinisphaera sp. Q1T1-3]